MELLQKNPFSTTKANDFDDAQIVEQWVDIGNSGALDLFSPCSQKAIYIQGGKGSGKTHLMRYFSYRSQILRHGVACVLDGIQKDGYLGVYLQSSGIQDKSLRHLSLSEQVQESLSIYSVDLYLAILFLNALNELKDLDNTLFVSERAFCDDVLGLFTRDIGGSPIESIEDLLNVIRDLKKSFDHELNNSAFDNNFKGEILASRSELVFRVPEIAAKHSRYLKGVTFLFIIDELENVSEPKQMYINSLIREKKPPVTFRLGARSHGMLTHKTLGSGEINKEGHEFQLLRLDEIYEGNAYEVFAIDLIINRLYIAGLVPSHVPTTGRNSEKDQQSRKNYLSELFEHADLSVLEGGRQSSGLTPLLKSFKSHLGMSGLTSNMIEEIISKLQSSKDLILQAACIHIFCQKWSKRKESDPQYLMNLVDELHKIICSNDPYSNSEITKKIGKYKNNYVATALRATKKNNLDQYTGFSNLLSLSKGVPRHILNLLGHIYDSEVFSGNKPFRFDTRISIKSQKSAVKNASDWFFSDSVTEGEDGPELAIILDRICEVLRIEYYADKPVECSASGFDLQFALLTDNAKRLIRWAELLRVLLPASTDRQEKNSDKLLKKYYLNVLLCPKWGLPVKRRGSISLSEVEANAIFDPSFSSEYEEFISKFEASRNAPFQIIRIEKEQAGFDF